MVAITMLGMTGCGQGSSSTYKQGDSMPSINIVEGTVNGKKYDTEKEACWKLTFKYTVKSDDSSTNGSEVSYVWGTEFGIVSTQEMAMWTAAQAGKYASASYSYVKTNDKDYNSCVDHNSK